MRHVPEPRSALPQDDLARSSRLQALQAAAPDGGVVDDLIRRTALAHDASHFLLDPLAVAVPDSVEAVASLVSAAGRTGVGVTFRSGGTSLSGQASSDGLLLDVRGGFRSIDVLDAGERVRAGSGATLRAVNARLARFGRKLGPDPASEVACTIGGVIANNSSGMSCGTEHNAYRTVDSMVLALPSGTIIDTGDPEAPAILEAREPALHDDLIALRERILEDATSVGEIRRQFAMKNTMGYGLNSFLDHDTPLDILQRLVIGSEGTLAFVASAVFRTIPRAPLAGTALLVFPSLHDALASVTALASFGCASVELMDATSLRVAQRERTAADALRALDVRQHAALLVELEGSDRASFDDRLTNFDALIRGLPVVAPTTATEDAATRAALWHARKGLYATVAGERPAGSTALLEDIAVPGDHLLSLCTELGPLLAAHGYADPVLFGHAKDGNVHFMMQEQFDHPDSVPRFSAFTEDLASLVLGLGGTLKAEHGTGRMMAPYVRRQYGDVLYGVMQDVKRAFDPNRVLNPGVLITDDPISHLRDLKTMPQIDAEVTRCVECGYCEPACPSADLTLTPRQRIVVRRALRSAEIRGEADLAASLRSAFTYDGIDTCAVDGMCATLCPLDINTADLVRNLRAEKAPAVMRHGWNAAAAHWDHVTTTASTALSAARRVPRLASAASEAARRLIGEDSVPQWTPDLPGGGSQRAPLVNLHAQAVIFPSCTGTIFGSGGEGADAALRSLCTRAGIALRTPEDVDALCCGTPWKSKGLLDGHATMQALVEARLWEATEQGRLPVLSDSSSCAEGLQSLLGRLEAAGRPVSVIDAVRFVADVVLPRLTLLPRIASIVLHPTCASVHLGSDAALRRLGEAIAHEVVIPDDWGCCGFAGDRGMLHPELTEHATRREAASVRSQEHAAHASTNRTCELAMTRATGREYRHILEVLAAQCR